MAYIWIKLSPCISLIWFWYGFNQGQKVCNDIKIVYISKFSQFQSREGGSLKINFFPNSKKSKLSLGGGGGQGNYGVFPHFMAFFVLNPPLIQVCFIDRVLPFIFLITFIKTQTLDANTCFLDTLSRQQLSS